MIRKSCLAAAAIAFVALSPGLPAYAGITTKAGLLTCHVDQGFGFVFGSSRSLAFTFTSAKTGRVEHYTGDISKFRVDIGYLQSGVIAGAELAPTVDLAAGALSGDYVGATAGGSVAVDAGLNVLSGGSEHALSLQPISVEGVQGLNIAAGIVAIRLQLAS